VQPDRCESNERFAHLAKVLLFCALALGLNIALFMIGHLLTIPLFLDTVGTVAVGFAFGFFPGVAVAALTWLADYVFLSEDFHPYFFVAAAEVLLVSLLRSGVSGSADSRKQPAIPRDRAVSVAGVFARLTLLYLICVVATSVLGGAIDFLYHTAWGAERADYFTAVDTIRASLLHGGIPVPVANVLSRLQINLVDRFVAIFGGYLVSRGLWRLTFQRRGQLFGR